MTENQAQAMLFEWAAYNSWKYPELRLLFHIPNGGYRPPKTAAILKATGVKAGVPDIFFPVPRGGYNGLFIEMKRAEGGYLTSAQAIWLNNLSKQGYRAVCCKGFEAARDELLTYLNS